MLVDIAGKVQLGNSLLLLSSSCKLKHPSTSGLLWFGFPSVLRHLAGTSGNLCLSKQHVSRLVLGGVAGGRLEGRGAPVKR